MPGDDLQKIDKLLLYTESLRQSPLINDNDLQINLPCRDSFIHKRNRPQHVLKASFPSEEDNFQKAKDAKRSHNILNTIALSLENKIN